MEAVKQFSVPMALVDFIPVFLFGISAVLLQRGLYNKMSKGAFALFAAGTINVFTAGLLKALYKLLYAMNICDFAPLNNMFFPVQSIGFLLAGIGVIAMLVHKQTETVPAVAAAPAAFSGTFIFVTLMVLGFGFMNFGLAAVAKKLKKPVAVVLFCVSFVFSMMMGYLSSRNFEQASMNWIAEGVNILGQIALLTAVCIIHKAGLKELKLEKRSA
ncbi:MAG: hypothetical protein IKF49_07785 [Clostridia bacterium]|nr:hypothetical protein [Clostridia bacterium]